jgi:hypothetical protein
MVGRVIVGRGTDGIVIIGRTADEATTEGRLSGTALSGGPDGEAAAGAVRLTLATTVSVLNVVAARIVTCLFIWWASGA